MYMHIWVRLGMWQKVNFFQQETLGFSPRLVLVIKFSTRFYISLDFAPPLLDGTISQLKSYVKIPLVGREKNVNAIVIKLYRPTVWIFY